MVKFITGRAGSGKTTCLFNEIKNNSGKQLVIVPEQFSYEFDKKLYSFIGARKFNEIFSLSFTGLARQLFQIYGEPDRKGEYADDYARMILIYQAVSSVQSNPDALKYFRRQSTCNGFAEEVLDLINNMKRSGISPQMLTEKSTFLDSRLMDKTNDIADIYSEYEKLMGEYGFKDNFENIIEASKIAFREKWFRGMNVYIDEFESFTGDQLEMIRVMIASAENVFIALRTDNVKAGEFTLFDTVNRTYRQITRICEELSIFPEDIVCENKWRFNSADLEYLSSHIMRNDTYGTENGENKESIPEPDNIRIFEAGDMYSEVEYVCATIKHLICNDKKLKYRDIAVISNNMEEYADILKDTFERCEIPYFLSMAKSVIHTSIMVFLTSLLDLLTARKLKTENIFRLLKCGILDISAVCGDSDGDVQNVRDSLTVVAEFENYCYKWNIDGNTWNKPFTDEEDGKFEKIRAFIVEPIKKLRKRLSGKNTATSICRMLYEYLAECGAEKSVNRIMGELVKLERDYEASELKRLWSCIMDILDSIAGTFGEKVISFSETARIIKSMIGKIEYSVPPQTLDSVMTASARTARLSSPKIVFVIGANDGDFPSNGSTHGLFSETDKCRLYENGIEISHPLSEIISAERLVVYKALSYASDKLFVTYTLSDLSGTSKYPASVTDNIIDMFMDRSILIKKEDIPLDYYAVTLHSAFYHYMQNINQNNSYTSSIKKILMDVPEYRSRIEYVTNRSQFRQDYRIDTDVMQKLEPFEPLHLSATGVEEYSKCHFMHFCKKFLRLRDYEKIEINSMIAGDIMHRCFCGVLRSTTKEQFINMPSGELRKFIEKYAEEYKDKELAGDFSKNASFEFMFRKIIDFVIFAFIHLQNELANTAFVPADYEVRLIGKHALRLDFGNGYELDFSGTIDRADICRIGDEKYLRIIDYKSSEKKITPENLAGGLNLQMLLYLFTATEANGIFSGHTPAGVLYSPVFADDEKENINSAFRSTGLVLGRRKVLEAMEAGVKGEFIPVKFNKTNKNKLDSNCASCVTSDSMEKLRSYVYGRLVEMAESLLAGNVEAIPQVTKDSDPCKYCNYVDICNNSGQEETHTPDGEVVEKMKKILDNHLEKQGAEE